jgi:pimeloyl-ACP methyl ester carboxylesterase
MPYFEYGSKKIFYEKFGNGMPLILLHGNSVSLKMFANILDLYKNDYKIVLIDFLGLGRSDRLKEFPIDFWYDEALQVIRLLELKEFSKADIIGTSGGALVALNVALERPDLVNRLIADSFEGEKSLDSFANNVSIDRKNAKNVQRAR